MLNKENPTRPSHIKHIKTPSLRDLMLGKKTVKALPDNFFERVLELEIKLKRGFSMETLQELVNYYSCAIEYFESIEDSRYKDYQVSLNLLLTQPEILKKMSSMNRSGKVNPQPGSSAYANKYKQEQMKKQMRLKVDFTNSQGRDTQVKKLINEVKISENSAKDIDTLVNKDISNQEVNFKKRLEEKRKKILLSTSDLTEQIESIKNKRVPLESKNNANKSFIIEGKNDNMILPADLEGPDVNNISFNQIGGREEETGNVNFIESLNNSFEKLMQQADAENDETPAGDNSAIDHSHHRDKPYSHVKLKTAKQKQIFNDLKTNMDNFLTDFNFYFYDEVFQNVVEEVQAILEEKHKKTLEISQNYNNQIKEYEFLISSDSDSTYKESLTSIIEQLKEELSLELEKLDDQYDQIIRENKKKYRNMTLKSNSGIQLIEEKFRFEMLNSISNILYPTSKEFKGVTHSAGSNNKY